MVVSPTLPAPRPLEGREWFEARVALARTRSGRFNKRWAIVVGTLTLIAAIVPLASGDPRGADRSRLARMAADTLRSAQRVRRADAARANAESLLATALRRPAVARAAEPPPPRPVV